MKGDFIKDSLIINDKNEEESLSLYRLLKYQSNHNLFRNSGWKDHFSLSIKCIVEFLENFENEIKDRAWSDSTTCCIFKKAGVESFFNPKSIKQKFESSIKDAAFTDECILTIQLLYVGRLYRLAEKYSDNSELSNKYIDMINQCGEKYVNVFHYISNLCKKHMNELEHNEAFIEDLMKNQDYNLNNILKFGFMLNDDECLKNLGESWNDYDIYI